MLDDTGAELPVRRRGYDRIKVDAYVATLTTEIDRLAAENRAVHRRLSTETTDTESVVSPATTEHESTRLELEQMVKDARVARDGALAELSEAKTELERVTEATRRQHEDGRAAVEAAQVEIVRLAEVANDGPDVHDVRVAVETMRIARERVRGEIETAREQLECLVRARIEVHRELAELDDTLRRWLRSERRRRRVDARAAPPDETNGTLRRVGPGA
ncbi:MAG: hypothetical protein GY745_16340 [Actinomycetia bacterium]|nr:hypothetical protein [Actinomycetes bacterium]